MKAAEKIKHVHETARDLVIPREGVESEILPGRHDVDISLRHVIPREGVESLIFNAPWRIGLQSLQVIPREGVERAKAP